MPTRVLFVCTGNTCRSPMAELYFNELCRRLGRDDLVAVSAGISAWPGGRISRQAAAVLAGFGIDATGFRSRILTPELVGASDLVVTMTARHRDAIVSAVPEAAAKCRLLLPDGRDVPDPCGGSVDLYKQVFAVMKDALEFLAADLAGAC